MFTLGLGPLSVNDDVCLGVFDNHSTAFNTIG